MILEREKKDILECYNKYGWSIRELSDEYRLDISEIKEIVGFKPDLKKSISSQETTGKEYQLLLKKQQEKEKKSKNNEDLIGDFRDNGCAFARCPKCLEIMDDVKVVEYDKAFQDFHYECENCGFVDFKDVACKDKCCREGLGRLLMMKYGDYLSKKYDINKLIDLINEWIKTGKR